MKIIEVDRGKEFHALGRSLVSKIAHAGGPEVNTRVAVLQGIVR